MPVYRIADLNIKIENKHEHLAYICKNYLAENQDKFDFEAFADESDYEKDRAVVPKATDGYLEALSVYRCIANKLIDFDGFVLHASVIEKNGLAFAFSAKSGTGKTTHSRMWLKAFPDARIINGDKPLVRVSDGNFYAYGTPWCGKENYNINAKGRLKAICFIERGEVNEITRISKEEAVKRIYTQLLMPKSAEYINKMFDLVERFIESVPAFVLKCNISEEAANVAFNGMIKEINK